MSLFVSDLFLSERSTVELRITGGVRTAPGGVRTDGSTRLLAGAIKN